ncbi:MAG: type II and III secretion system protein family protein [Sphingobium sp.]|uniref:type II and III secretion system protein family protein n=1 Tax=Sphingobium sp. TaxID=1912891 RepID=UPI0029AB6535|nr:type II and III secretion system protein family protein [Sphingobium sp.]
MTLTKFLARKRSASLLAIGLALAGGFVPTAALNAAPSVSSNVDGAVVLSVGASRVINLSAKISDVIVVNPAVADVYVRSSTQIYILAKNPGETTISAVSKSGQTLYSAVIRVGNNLTSVDQMLKLAIPDADVQVSTMNGMILLTGTIKAPEDAAEAERLTQAFVGKEVTVVSRLRTATPIQVNLQVRIAEVSRNLLHQVGMNWYLKDPTQGFRGHIARANRDFVAVDGAGKLQFQNQPTDNRTTLGFISKLFGMDVAGALDLAETSGLATSLAQPNLTSLSGETASFLAGGEFPYQVSNGLQGNSIEFKQYGVQLAFTPTVLADGRISLRVRPTVSSLDFSINSAVPALKSRAVETTVELGSGQAFMIAGLLNNDTSNNIDKIPGIGDIPILGSLFKSRKFLRNETELVVVITPYLVKPVNARDIRLPTDGFRSATEAQGLFLQQGSDGISGARDPGPKIAPSAPDASPIARATSTKQPKLAKSSGAAAPGFSF